MTPQGPGGGGRRAAGGLCTNAPGQGVAEALPRRACHVRRSVQRPDGATRTPTPASREVGTTHPRSSRRGGGGASFGFADWTTPRVVIHSFIHYLTSWDDTQTAPGLRGTEEKMNETDWTSQTGQWVTAQGPITNFDADNGMGDGREKVIPEAMGSYREACSFHGRGEVGLYWRRGNPNSRFAGMFFLGRGVTLGKMVQYWGERVKIRANAGDRSWPKLGMSRAWCALRTRACITASNANIPRDVCGCAQLQAASFPIQRNLEIRDNDLNR